MPRPDTPLDDEVRPRVITGSFVMHYTDTTPPARALEWSVTRDRAMTTPEYHIEVTRFGVLPPPS